MEILNPIWPNNWLDLPCLEQSVPTTLFTGGLLATDVTYHRKLTQPTSILSGNTAFALCPNALHTNSKFSPSTYHSRGKLTVIDLFPSLPYSFVVKCRPPHYFVEVYIPPLLVSISSADRLF